MHKKVTFLQIQLDYQLCSLMGVNYIFIGINGDLLILGMPRKSVTIIFQNRYPYQKLYTYIFFDGIQFFPVEIKRGEKSVFFFFFLIFFKISKKRIKLF